MDSGAFLMTDGGGPALFARIAEECIRSWRKEWAKGEERTFADLAHKVTVRGLDTWEHCRVFSPAKWGTQYGDLVDTHWVLTWKEFDGEKRAKARFAAKGYQDSDLCIGVVDTAD